MFRELTFRLGFLMQVGYVGAGWRLVWGWEGFWCKTPQLKPRHRHKNSQHAQTTSRSTMATDQNFEAKFFINPYRPFRYS